jgi:hypothetical protein
MSEKPAGSAVELVEEAELEEGNALQSSVGLNLTPYSQGFRIRGTD